MQVLEGLRSRTVRIGQLSDDEMALKEREVRRRGLDDVQESIQKSTKRLDPPSKSHARRTGCSSDISPGVSQTVGRSVRWRPGLSVTALFDTTSRTGLCGTKYGPLTSIRKIQDQSTRHHSLQRQSNIAFDFFRGTIRGQFSGKCPTRATTIMKRSREPEEVDNAGVDETGGQNVRILPACKLADIDPSAVEDTGITMRCSLPPHKDERSFKTYEEFEVHYNKVHTNRCLECRKNFPSNHYLDLHIEECHDPLVAVQREKGDHTVSSGGARAL